MLACVWILPGAKPRSHSGWWTCGSLDPPGTPASSLGQSSQHVLTCIIPRPLNLHVSKREVLPSHPKYVPILPAACRQWQAVLVQGPRVPSCPFPSPSPHVRSNSHCCPLHLKNYCSSPGTCVTHSGSYWCPFTLIPLQSVPQNRKSNSCFLPFPSLPLSTLFMNGLSPVHLKLFVCTLNFIILRKILVMYLIIHI